MPKEHWMADRADLTLKDVATAWIKASRCAQLGWIDEDLPVEANTEKELLFELFGLSEDTIEVAATEGSCPAALTRHFGSVWGSPCWIRSSHS